MNLQGSANYNPRLPWVSKVREADGGLAADVVTYVDDARPLGPKRKNTGFLEEPRKCFSVGSSTNEFAGLGELQSKTPVGI
jgi:hypothetical protein